MVLEREYDQLGKASVKRIVVVVFNVFALTSCSALPQSGPTSGAIEKKESHVLLSGYQLIDATENVVRFLNSVPEASFGSLTRAQRTHSAGAIGIGDTVVVTIWESGSGGLFSQATSDGVGGGAKHTALPEQLVSRQGTIAVPYGGSIRVGGLTPEQAGDKIARSLKDKAIDPEAMLTVVKSVGSGVSVVGAVGRSGRVPLIPGADRLMDVIADAGGFTVAEYEASIQLNRGSQVARVPLSTVLDRPEENIVLQPGDTVTVTKATQSFTAFGATGLNNKIPFGTAKLSLTQALGLAYGLSDLRADTKSVFLMRYETVDTLRTVLNGRPMTVSPTSGSVPVIYRFDLSDPGGFLLAERFRMKNKDIIYISNARLTDVQKFVSLLTTAVQVPNSIVSTQAGVAGSIAR